MSERLVPTDELGVDVVREEEELLVDDELVATTSTSRLRSTPLNGEPIESTIRLGRVADRYGEQLAEGV